MCSSTRGPATSPSLVTCPAMMTGVWFVLAHAMSSRAHSRICPTLPGAADDSSEWSVCMESTSTAQGCMRSIHPSTSGAAVSFNNIRLRPLTPSRSARMRICTADSSPATYSTDPRLLASSTRGASAPATCSMSVDLPMPGSPASSATEPGTSPPPSTRLSSANGSTMRGSSSSETPESSTGPADVGRNGVVDLFLPGA